MRGLAILVICLTTVAAAAAVADVAGAARGGDARAAVVAAGPAADAARADAVVGRSSQGRPIELVRRGDPAAPTTVLVVGSIHGTEPAGHAVIAQLRRMPVPAGLRLLLVPTANPDGVAAGTRQNARGVDLNRNFPFRWRGHGRPFDTYFPGPAPASEPETRAMQALVRREHPAVTVWYHQHLHLVTLVPGANAALIRAYGARTGLPPRVLPPYRGTATSWQNHTFPGTSAFVVELPAGPLTPAGARRHGRAVLAVGELAAGAAPAVARAARPPIVPRPIPFGPRRRREMAAYSLRHYGEATARLTDPKVIVEHYTATESYSSAWNTFAADAPDVELHERPGVCAHFLIDRDGTITQLVPLSLRCRHTIGLNHVAIGIEHVGVSDAGVMGNRRELAASLRLTRWLQGRFGIPTRDVIGHAESLSSPYFREDVTALRGRTHADFAHAAMQAYRAMLSQAFSSRGTRVAGTPARTASSWAAKARPRRIASAVSSVHSRTAIVPANGP
jgi:beta-N-acetylhexosaminidase